MTAENEIIDYLYSQMTKLMVPVTQVPSTPAAVINPLMKEIYKKTGAEFYTVSQHLPYDRAGLETLIGRMIPFEKFTKPVGARSVWNVVTPIARTSETESPHDWQVNEFARTCVNHIRLFELHDFLRNVPDDFVISLQVRWIKGEEQERQGAEGRIVFYKTSIEFSVGLEGITLDLKMPKYEREALADRWALVCARNGYYSDFSQLLDSDKSKVNVNALIFLMDYTAEGYRMQTR